MFYKIKIILTILGFLFVRFAFAQKDKRTDAIELLIEQIAENSDAELDYTRLAEDLYFFSENPLNLNTAVRADLERIQFLNDFQIEDILGYTRRYGDMISIYELGRMQSFSQTDINRILPFVGIKDSDEKRKLNIRNILRYGNHSLFLRSQTYVEKQKGYTPPEEPDDTRYLGNSMSYYTRYQFNYKRKILFGVVGEKDPGEEFFTGSQKRGFDHVTAHFELRDIGKVKSLCIGDYSATAGQGLIIGTGLYSGKSPSVMKLNKSNEGVRKYSSTGENQYLRGVAGTVNLGDFNITGFVSYKNIDGNIDITDTLTNEVDVISSFQNSGYHRTESELIDRKSISEFIVGGNFKWFSKYFKVGANYIQYNYGAELNSSPDINEQFDFYGNSGANLSVDYQANYKNLYFFGEVAGSKNMSVALLNGALLRVAPGIGFSVLHRHYDRNYQAQYAGAFAEQSGVQNEKGLYMGVEAFPIRKWKVAAYFDMYSFPWLDYRKDAPSLGEDYFAQIDFSPNRHIDMYWRFKHETKFENSSETISGINSLVPAASSKVRFHISYPVTKTVKLKSRVAYAHYKKGIEKNVNGFMLYQDVAWKPRLFPLTFYYRFALFDADYYARLYAYENDILYAFSVPAYSGQGMRSYVTVKYTIVDDFLDIWLRYALTHYTDRDVIGSGLTEIEGRNKSQVKLQLRIKF